MDAIRIFTNSVYRNDVKSSSSKYCANLAVNRQCFICFNGLSPGMFNAR